MVEKRDLLTLIDETLSYWTQKGHSSASIRCYKKVFHLLEVYCAKNNVTQYTKEIGVLFMDAKHSQMPPISRAGLVRYGSTIRKLDCILTGEVFAPLPFPNKLFITSCYDDLVAKYEGYLYKSQMSKKRIRGEIVIIVRFLKYLDECGCSETRNITAKHIYDAFRDAPGINKSPFRRAVNSFLRYAYTYGIIREDFSRIIPKVVRHQGVASVYTPEEVERLLESIERTTECGKRDYAIVLIAARLGLRASDIAALTLENIKLKKGMIELIQRKTKVPLSLPLIDDIRSAIFDYINNGRPDSDEEQIFLHRYGYGAILPSGVGAAVKKRLLESGIKCGNRGLGSHALRTSLATALLAEGNDYRTIQKALGHTDVQSTKVYAKTDIEQLRVNALPVPSPTGTFETLLNSGGYCQ